jgi:hypothetical protein
MSAQERSEIETGADDSGKFDVSIANRSKQCNWQNRKENPKPLETKTKFGGTKIIRSDRKIKILGS